MAGPGCGCLLAGLPAELAAGRAFELLSADGRLTLSVAPRAGAGHTLCPVTLTNAGTEQAWLLVRAVARFRPTGDWHYVNGNYSTLTPLKLRRRTSIGYTLPMCAAYDGAAGVGLGFDPFQIFSYIENEGRPVAGDGASIAYGVKIVLDPGQSETVRLRRVGGSCPAQWLTTRSSPRRSGRTARWTRASSASATPAMGRAPISLRRRASAGCAWASTGAMPP